MKEKITQIDIINNLLPGSILTETEKKIIEQIQNEKEENKFLIAAYPLSEEQKENLIKEAHPYIGNLLQTNRKRGKIIFESFADWYDLKAISYDNVVQYIQGKAAHQILEYNLIKTSKMTEEELKSYATKRLKKLKVLINSGMKLDTKLPLEEKLKLYQSINIISQMYHQGMVDSCDNAQFLEELEFFGTAMFYVEGYYKNKDQEIDSYIENRIKKEIEHKEKNKDNSSPKIFIKKPLY